MPKSLSATFAAFNNLFWYYRQPNSHKTVITQHGLFVTATRVKICGITSVADAQVAQSAGADAIGLVFYEPSPRAATLEQAQAIAATLGPFTTVVGLFVNAEAVFVRKVLDQVGLHLLQFHGDESRGFCEQFARPYLKALAMRPGLDIEAEMALYPSAAGFLLDAYRPGVPGGTGETFDWQRVPRNTHKPIVLAGGLKPENVVRAVSATGVYGVDVSSGVESAPGKKDAQKIDQFIRNAKAAYESMTKNHDDT